MVVDTWQTPLHVAVEAEQEEIARILIEEGASPDVRDNFGKLPEDEATQDMLFILKKTTCNSKCTANIITENMLTSLSYNHRWFLHSQWVGLDSASNQSRG